MLCVNIVFVEMFVKTEKGKSVSKWNVLKHGVLRESISEYEKLAYEALYMELVEELEPLTPLETLCSNYSRE